jgi:glycosyltransferase involved in cell wall biosynthesis
MKVSTLYLVIPSFNEQPVLLETAKHLRIKMEKLIKAKKISSRSRIVFVDDGSRDRTWPIIEQLHQKNKLFSGIKLSRNRGHQNALLAGLMSAKDRADIVISMDADLQDDINAIDTMLSEYNQGAEIVYGVRNARKKDSFFKRTTALIFYKLMLAMGVDSVYNHADYRLMSKRALNELANFREVNLFLRGLIPLIGFKTATVKYERAARFAGKSKYPLRKMLNFAIDGITSFSVKPLRVITALGFLVSLGSLLVLAYALYRYINGATVAGWTFTIFSIWLLGGLQMTAIGVVGEYIGKIYTEVKERPRYIIEKKLIK